MQRDIDLSQVTDGKLYRSTDMVRVGTKGCSGCSECCRIVGDTILLDAWDIYHLEKALNTGWNTLLKEFLELQVVEGLIRPNLKVKEDGSGCVFLNSEGRCRIHDHRPGFCRMFPLGRLYGEKGFSYILQVHECPVPNKTKIRVDKWIGIPELDKYESYIDMNHRLEKRLMAFMDEAGDDNIRRNVNLLYLHTFIADEYNTDKDFYRQYEKRLQSLLDILGIPRDRI